jgi:uncharacterized membrane protein YedE/YeeE
MDWLSLSRWSPYAVGAGIGVLSWLAFALSDRPLGCSTAFSRSCGMLERLLRGPEGAERPYYQKITPTIDWQWTLVVGILIGAFLSAKLSGTARFEWVPSRWAAAFGDSSTHRWLVALGGGVLMGVGSRWAGGCTSGHGISGTLQLAASGWLAVLAFFAGGVLIAWLIH